MLDQNKYPRKKVNNEIVNGKTRGEVKLTIKQYSKLDEIGVFDIINEKCDIIIDEYEEEVLELDKIPIALEVVTQLINDNKDEELVRLKEMLNLAITYKTIVGFDF